MKKYLSFVIILIILLSTMTVMAKPVSACHWRKAPKAKVDENSIVKEYDDIMLSGGMQAGHFNDIWNLSAGDLKVSFTYDGTALVDDGFDPFTLFGTMANGQFGIRDTTTTDSAPFGKGIWFNSLYDVSKDTFDPENIIDTDWDNIPDTKADNFFDLDDQLMLQKGGPYWNEQDYDLPSGAGNPLASYGIWFDRDGVSSTQKDWWGFDDGGIYNTGGIYDVELSLKATGDTSGEAFLNINGLKQGFWATEWNNSEPEMYPAGMTFTGDMTQMQVFYSIFGVGAIHNISFTNIKVVQTIEHDLTINIDIDINGQTIQSNVDRNIPKNLKMYFELHVNPRIICDDTILVDIITNININKNLKVNVDLNIDVSVIEADEDVEMDIDIFVKDASDVHIDGAFNIEDVEDDALIDFVANVQNSKNVWINFDSEVQDINDDAKTLVNIVVKNSGVVRIDVNTNVHDISDDSQIWIKIKTWKNDEVTKNISVVAQDIGDKSKIWKTIWIW